MKDDFIAFKEKLKDASDIVSVVSRYVALNKKGKTWWANCPFHFEKTPSFAVNELDQFYHCFGCGVSGDVFGFVQKIESVDFIEACEILAKYANLKMPEFSDNENIAKLKRDKEVAHRILNDATEYYINNLKTPQGKPGADYIQKRKLTAETVRDFKIGYSVGWNEVVNEMLKKYTPAELKISGLVDEKDGKLYDAYAKRLIFPIVNANGDTIGFSARLLENADFAKYKNTAQTIVFDKSKVLFGINNIKKIKQTEALNEIIIVEGQMDLISIYQNGIKNAVATMGTALTPLHAKELKRYCDKVVLCFDGDGAGRKAAERSVEILASSGLDVYVAKLPNGQDPDEYIIQNGKEEFLKIINSANYWIDYLIYEKANSFDLEKRNEKNEFINEALKIIKKLDSFSEQVVYLDLVKKITNISVDILKKDLENLNVKQSQNTTITDTQQNDSEFIINKENAYVKAVKFVVASLMHKKEYADDLPNLKDYILNNDYIKILNYIDDSHKANKIPIISALYDMFEVDKNPDINAIISYDFSGGVESKEYYLDCFKIIKKYGFEAKRDELMKEIRLEKDLDKRRELTYKLQEIIKQMQNL